MSAIHTVTSSALFGSLADFRKDPVGFLGMLHGQPADVVKFRLAHQWLYYVRGPEALQDMFRQWNTAEKAQDRRMKAVLGQGIVFMNGDTWAANRKAMVPYFHRQALGDYVSIMHQQALVQMEGMPQAAAKGQPFAASDACYQVAIRVVRDCLFGTDHNAEEIQKVLDGVQILLDYSVLTAGNPLYPPLWVPTPKHQSVKAWVKTVDEVIHRTLHQKRHAPESDTSLIRMLLHTQDEQGQRLMDDTTVADHVKIFFVAGTETSANTMAFALWQLAQHSQWQQRVVEEVRRVLGSRAITMEDIPQLPTLRQVLLETLRLYPATWINLRRTSGPIQLGDAEVPGGVRLMFSTYWHHRNPALWENPESFRPDRFVPGVALPSYFQPFITGPRKCIGDQFALTEMMVVLATWLQHYSFQLPAGSAPKVKFGATLSLDPPLQLLVTPVG